MKPALVLLLLGLSVFFAACAGSAPSPPTADVASAPDPLPSAPPEANRLAPGYLPTPFSAAELRATLTHGAFRKFRNETADSVRLQTMTFLDGNKNGAIVEAIVADENDQELRRVTSSPTSSETFQGHASYEELLSSVRHERVRVIAGDFDCWVYTTIDLAGADVEASFALDLPGPPILMVTTKDGQPVARVELIDYGPR